MWDIKTNFEQTTCWTCKKKLKKCEKFLSNSRVMSF